MRVGKVLLNKALKSSNLISWKSSGRLQQTLARHVEVTGKGLHSGKESTVTIYPELAGKGRTFDLINNSNKTIPSIPATIDFVLQNSPLCTTLSSQQFKVRTVEHLLSALEATGVDNCRIHISNNTENDCEFEVPILDGSAKWWVEAIEEGGVAEAEDERGNKCERMAPYLTEPFYLQKNDSFVVAFPSPNNYVSVTCGIDFSKVPAIGHQWFSVSPLNPISYIDQIAPSRTFCIYEEVEHMRKMGLIKGGSADNAIVCSETKGWINPPLRFSDEPCRHKILDLVGDFSLLSRLGNQGLPVAHIIAYKGGHALHAEFAHCLNESYAIEELSFPTI